MPIYEFHCKNCEDKVEVLQPMSASKMVICKTCGKIRTKFISVSHAHYKGSGFYVNESKGIID